MIKTNIEVTERFTESYRDTNGDPIYLLPTTKKRYRVYFLGIKVWDTTTKVTSTGKRLKEESKSKGKGIGYA